MIEAIRKRRSIRKYTTQPVSDEQVEQILLSAMFAPSAWGKCPWHFIVVRDKEILKRLSEAQQWSGMVADSNVTIVVCGDKMESDLWVEDASITATFIALAVTDLGLGSCWIQIRGDKHGEGEAEDFVREVLSVPDKWGILCMFPIGYPAETLPPHTAAEFDHEKISRETYGH